MNIKLIKSESDYKEALNRLEVIFDSKKGTSEGDELEILSLLIEKYEDEHFPFKFPDPIEAIKFTMKKYIDLEDADKELIELSGSTENYLKDMPIFLENLENTIKKMRSTKSGKARLKKAGLK